MTGRHKKVLSFLLLAGAVLCLTLTGGLLGGVALPLSQSIGIVPTKGGHGLGDLQYLFLGSGLGAVLGLVLGIWLVLAGIRLLKKLLFVMSMSALLVLVGAYLWVNVAGGSW